MYAQTSQRYLLHKPSYIRFCPKFSCHGIRRVNLNDTVELAVPESHTLEPKTTTLSCIQPELCQFKEFLNFPIGAIVKFRLFRLNNSVKFHFKFKLSNPKRHYRAQNRVICI